MINFKKFMSKKSFCFVGDIMQHPDQLRYEESSGFKYECFDEVKSVWKNSDYVFGNLETTFAGFKTSPDDREPEFCAPDELASALKRVGFTHISICNNHMFDKGIEGVKRTKEVLKKSGLVPVFNNLIIDDFEVLNFTTHLNKELSDEYSQIKTISDKKTKIAIPHWGGQYVPITDEQLSVNKELNSLGFNIVMGSGPHAIQNTFVEDTKITAYSLGDFLACHQKPGSINTGKIITFDLIDGIIMNFIERNVETFSDNGKSIIKFV